MGSSCSLQLYAANTTQANDCANAIINEINRIETRFSRFQEDSFLSTINQIAQSGGSISVDPETTGLLNYAFALHKNSNGLFAISSGLLQQLWNFDTNQLPNPQHIQQLLPRVGMDKIIWESPNLKFPVEGMQLDLGGIGKEYAADRAVTLCKEMGHHHGLVDLGGDLAIIGPHPDGSPWKIGIQHPRQSDQLLETITLEQGGLASSGDYERCIIIDGQRFSHIIHPQTGWPVQGLASVTIAAEHCLVAGSIATIAMLKETQAISWLHDLNIPHRWVDVHGQCGGSFDRRSMEISEILGR